jgi:HEAT repeat protein
VNRGSARVCALALCLASSAPVTASGLEWPGRGEAAQTAFDAANTAEQRALALQTIGTTGDPQTADLLSSALRDVSPIVRAAACEALVRSDRGLAAALLIDRLGDRAASVRVAAASGLGSLRAGEAVEPLTRLLSDPESAVRVAAVEALSAMADATAAQSLLQALRDTDRAVAVAALRGLEQRGERGVLPAVLARVDDPEREVAIAAIQTAGVLGGADQTMQRLARYGTTEIAVAALRALRGRTAPEVVRFLAALGVESRDAQVRVAALEALIVAGGPAAIPLLERQLVASDAAARAESGLVLEYFATVGPRAWAPLEAVALRSPRRAELWHTWLRSGDSRAVRAVVARTELSGEEAVALLRSSPLPEALCSASRFALQLDDAQEVEWAQWAFELGAPACLELQNVRANWGPRAQLWVALALIERDAEEASEFAANLDLSSQSREGLVALFSLLGTAGQDVRLAVAAAPTADDRWVQRELAVVSLQLYLEGLDEQRDIAERRLTGSVVGVGSDMWAALRCTGAQLVAASSSAPEGVQQRRAWAVRALACGLSDGADGPPLSHDPSVGIAQLTVAPIDELVKILGDSFSDASVRAQALLRLGVLDGALADANAVAYLNSRTEILRAAAWSVALLPEEPEPLNRLRRQIRTERSEIVLAVLAGRWSVFGGSGGEFASLGHSTESFSTNMKVEREYDYSVVSVHDRWSGVAVYDAIVVLVEDAGGMALQTTDLNGLSVIRSRDARSVFALSIEQRSGRSQ